MYIVQMSTSNHVYLKSFMQARRSNSVYIWGKFIDKEYPTPNKIKELQAKEVVSIDSGGFFYLAATLKGEVYGWGKTKYNRFGINQAENILIPKLIPLKIPIVKVATGNWHSMIIDNIGNLYAVGHNKSGACGLGHFQIVQTFSPVKIPPTIAKQISLGDCYSLILTKDNQLFSCGHAQFHGHPNKQHLHTPKMLPFKQKITAIGVGFTHSLAASSENTYSWGKGQFFQLGHGDKSDCKEPRAIKRLEGTRMVHVSCTRGEKNSHSMAVSADGRLFTWGAGYKGKLGHEKYWTHEDQADQVEPRQLTKIHHNIVKCAAGGIHSIAQNAQGQLLSFGCGSNGRLGHIESLQYRYLYREGYPRIVEALKQTFVVDVKASYYHNICLGYSRS